MSSCQTERTELAAGRAIRPRREAIGLSREQLAGPAGCFLAWLGAIERGYAPRLSNALPRVLAVLGDLESDDLARESVGWRGDSPTANTSSAQRSPNRVNRRGGNRGRRRRDARRAIESAQQTSAQIQGISRERQRSRAVAEANIAASLDSKLGGLYQDLRGDKRVSSGALREREFRGRTWRAR
jgi:transcriptional regulator with XRE-family HTH domain